MITALRSQTVRGIRNNFHSFYNNNIKCQLCLQSLDTQEHCIECPKILEKTHSMKKHISYEHIYGNVHQQKDIAQLYIVILKIREDLLQDQDKQGHGDEQDDQEEDDTTCPPAAIKIAGLINYEI